MIIKKSKQELTVITAIFGDYDILHKQLDMPNIKYICITDNPNIEAYNWEIIIDNELVNKNWSPRKKAYYVRYNIDKYIKNSKYGLWIDASIEIPIKTYYYIFNLIHRGCDFFAINFLNLNDFLYNGWLHDIKADLKDSEHYNDYLEIINYVNNKNIDLSKILIYVGYFRLFNLYNKKLISIVNNSFDDICIDKKFNDIILYDEPILSIKLYLDNNKKINIQTAKRECDIKFFNQHEIIKYNHNSNNLWPWKIYF